MGMLVGGLIFVGFAIFARGYLVSPHPAQPVIWLLAACIAWAVAYLLARRRRLGD